jgi:DNA-binding PadR family transcriptional regulator
VADRLLTPSDWAVLALVAEEPTHGFAIARALEPDGEVGRIWSVRRPLVYRALDLLKADGCLEDGGTAGGAGPRRQVVTITPGGTTVLRRWLREPVAHVRAARSERLLKLLFLERRGEEPARLLTAQQAAFAATLGRLDARHAAAEGFERTALLWRVETTRAALRFVEQLLDEVAPVARGAGAP